MEACPTVHPAAVDERFKRGASPSPLCLDAESYKARSRDITPTMVVIPAHSMDDDNNNNRAPSPLSCPLSFSPEYGTNNGPRAMSAPLPQLAPPPRSSVWDTKSRSHGSMAMVRRLPGSSISLASSSSSSDEESSRESVDLEEERLRAMIMNENQTVVPNAHGTTALQRWNGATGTATTMTMQLRQENAVTTIPLYPRQRSVTDASAAASDASDPQEPNSRRPAPFRSNSLSYVASRHQRAASAVTAHSRRNLLILFLVAVYTTFGLTTPNIPQENDLIFPDTVVPAEPTVVDVLEVSTESSSSVASAPTAALSDPDDATTASTKLRGFSASEATNVSNGATTSGKTGTVQSKLSFARRNRQTMLVFRKKEITDFYHQKALRDETSNLSWYYYLNVTVLVGIALWAMRQQSNSRGTTATTTQTDLSQQRASLL